MTDGLKLSEEESEMRQGAEGPSVQQAIEYQIKLAEFYGARELTTISNAHFTGDYEVMGDSGLAYLRDLAEKQAHVRVPTSRNSTCVDPVSSTRLRQKPRLVAGEAKFGPLLSRIGVVCSNTCIGYQTHYTPVRGEHVAWGDTGAVAYANSVLGARTNFEAGPASLLAGVSGRTPAFGFHLDAHRRANVIVDVDASLDDVADWGALGAIVGEAHRGYSNVPAIRLQHAEPTPDRLKHLAASIASYGSMAMFHVVGTTPEAPTLDEAVAGRDVIARHRVTNDCINDRVQSAGLTGQPADVVVFSGPQLSLWELRTIAAELHGQRVHPGTTLILTTNSAVLTTAATDGLIDDVAQAGAIILRGTCWYLMDPLEMSHQFRWKRVVTNSAKLANIVRAHGYEPAVRRTSACIRSAVTGVIA